MMAFVPRETTLLVRSSLTQGTIFLKRKKGASRRAAAATLFTKFEIPDRATWSGIIAGRIPRNSNRNQKETAGMTFVLLLFLLSLQVTPTYYAHKGSDIHYNFNCKYLSTYDAI